MLIVGLVVDVAIVVTVVGWPKTELIEVDEEPLTIVVLVFVPLDIFRTTVLFIPFTL